VQKASALLVILFVMVLEVLAGCAPKSASIPTPPVAQAQPAPQVETPAPVPTMPPMMTKEQVIQLQNSIMGILEEGRKDPVPGIRETMKWLFARLEKDKIGLAVSPVATGETVAISHWDDEAKMPMVVFMGPVLFTDEEKMPPWIFKELVLDVACHETLHLEDEMPVKGGVKFDSAEGRRKYIDGESKVWRKQILSIIRPKMDAHRSVDDNAAFANEYLQKACNDEDNATWRNFVAATLCTREP
jgi:hypothetical protein